MSMFISLILAFVAILFTLWGFSVISRSIAGKHENWEENEEKSSEPPKGFTWKEWLGAILVALIVGFIVFALAYWLGRFWWIPLIFIVLIIILMVKSNKTQRKALGWLLAAFAILAIVLGINATELATPAKQSDTAAVKKDPYIFYNLENYKDKDIENDFDFGYDRYAAAVKAFEASGKPETEREQFIANWIVADFYETITPTYDAEGDPVGDPAASAADIGYADAVLGTQFLGEFYEQCHEDWQLTLNTTKKKFMTDLTLWGDRAGTFVEFLKKYAIVSVEDITETVTDQMYQVVNAGGEKDIPDIIVRKTEQTVGHYLVFRIPIKGNEFILRYRIECGYQPTNVAKKMNITPQDPNPTPTQEPEPTSTPGPTPSPTNDDPEPTTPAQKDKSEAPDYQGNAEKAGVVEDGVDNSGPGGYEPPTSVQRPDNNTTTAPPSSNSTGANVDNGTPPTTAPIPVTDSSYGNGAVENDGGRNGRGNDEDVHKTIADPFS